MKSPSANISNCFSKEQGRIFFTYKLNIRFHFPRYLVQFCTFLPRKFKTSIIDKCFCLERGCREIQPSVTFRKQTLRISFYFSSIAKSVLIKQFITSLPNRLRNFRFSSDLKNHCSFLVNTVSFKPFPFPLRVISTFSVCIVIVSRLQWAWHSSRSLGLQHRRPRLDYMPPPVVTALWPIRESERILETYI